VNDGPPDERREPPEGREALEEEASGGTLAPSAELEEALREAADAVADPVEARGQPPTRGMRLAEGVKLPSDENRELREELDRLRAEADDARRELGRHEDRFVRLSADFDNFRKRVLREREEAHRYGSENLVKELLGVVDNLDRAVEHARRSEGADFESMLQGIELVQRQLQGALAKHGVTRIDAEGEPFDPTVHEAIAQKEEGTVPGNTVLQVFQPGYRLWDRLLRPARVVVSKPPRGADGGGEGAEG